MRDYLTPLSLPFLGGEGEKKFGETIPPTPLPLKRGGVIF